MDTVAISHSNTQTAWPEGRAVVAGTSALAREAPAAAEAPRSQTLELLPEKSTLAKMTFYKPATQRPDTGVSAFAATAYGTAVARVATGTAKTAQTAQQTQQAQGGAAQAAQDASQAQAMQAKPGVEPNTGCKTCQERVYQDGSDDSGVSFQGAKHIPAATAAITVASHEGEHVSRDSARAAEQNRIVTSKTVTLQMACCPECKRMYVAGGLTKMTTQAAPEPQNNADTASALELLGGAGENVDTYV